MHRGDPLHGGGPGFVDDDVLVGHDPQRFPHGVQEFPRPQEEVGRVGAAEAVVAGGERLVDQHPAGGDGRHHVGEGRAVEVVRDHDPGEA